MKSKCFCTAKIILSLVLLALAGLPAVAATDPRTNSWFTTYSSRYARIYTNDLAKTNGWVTTTWSNNSLAQSTPVYCGIQEIYSSSNWVYLRTTGLGGQTMGPWYNDATRTTIFVNMPVNQKVFYRIPRVPTVSGTKTTTTGEVGYMVDGVKLFDSRDAVSYITSTGQDGAQPGGVGSSGDGIWNRDAYVNEAITFDPSLAHQQNTGVYHYHASPLAVRYLLGDNVNFNSTNKLYTPNTNAPTKHSPIIAWANDGYPVYGPYGYSSASNSASGFRRMISGFVLRNGQYGTTNLSSTGRTTLAAWALRAQGRTNITASQYGPNVSTSFPLGRYVEDSDYLGDRGYTQGGGTFDLDEYNGRWCVTPEFPDGTYAYFNTIDASGNPAFPYNVGRQFYGVPTAGTASAISETVVTNFLGGTNVTEKVSNFSVSNNTVFLVWSGVEGGNYTMQTATNLASPITWSNAATGLTPTITTGNYSQAATSTNRFYRLARNGAATFDSAGTTTFASAVAVPGGTVTRGQTYQLTITLPTTPPNPPVDRFPTNILIGASYSVTNTASMSRPATNLVQVLVTIPTNATTGSNNVNLYFSPAPNYTLTGGIIIN